MHFLIKLQAYVIKQENLHNSPKLQSQAYRVVISFFYPPVRHIKGQKVIS